MKLRVNQDACIGCGLCVSLAEAVFSFNDDGKAVAAEVTADSEADAVAAKDSCPAAAIEEE